MSYSEESERNAYNSWENKQLGETYREAESRIEKSDTFQRNLEQQMDTNYQNERNRYRGSSGSYSGGYNNGQEITSLAVWIGRLGLLLLAMSSIALYYEIQLPAIRGVSFLQLSFQASIALIIIGFFPRLLIGSLVLLTIGVIFLKLRTPTGFQLNAMSIQDWLGIVALFAAAFIVKRLLIKN